MFTGKTQGRPRPRGGPWTCQLEECAVKNNCRFRLRTFCVALVPVRRSQHPDTRHLVHALDLGKRDTSVSNQVKTTWTPLRDSGQFCPSEQTVQAALISPAVLETYPGFGQARLGCHLNLHFHLIFSGKRYLRTRETFFRSKLLFLRVRVGWGQSLCLPGWIRLADGLVLPGREVSLMSSLRSSCPHH